MKHRFASLLLASCLALSAHADITATIGPTPIPRGNAQGENDITVNNGLFAVSFAVDSAPPWGHARGGIVDVAIIRDGVIGYDIASLADFMPNNWSSWPTTYQHIVIEKQTGDEVVIKTRRDWGKVELETLFQINDSDPAISVVTRMMNKGDDVRTDLLSGYIVWPDGGYLFGVAGLSGVVEGEETAATADWSAAYDAGWTIGLHAPFADRVGYNGRDRYLLHTLQPGEFREFAARIQIEANGDLAPIVANEIAFIKEAFGFIAGHVTTADGQDVDNPAVIVYKNETPFSWVIGDGGRYNMQLPVGEYRVYATAEGYSQSEEVAVTIDEASTVEQNFDDLQPPGQLTVRVADKTGLQPLDARISIEVGQKPLIEYLGKTIFFTELDRPGEATLSIAPGPYTFAISSADGFTVKSDRAEMVIKSGERQTLYASPSIEVKPSARGWYSADLHHHSDVLDGFTPPEYVLRSQLASGVDIAFLSDHDSIVNNERMRDLAASRDMHFIPATELSPSWGHFNAYPIDDGKNVAIDTGVATVQQVFGEARRLGADVISVNHPYLGYGYFESLEQTGVVPGGYDGDFDLVEINPFDNQRTVERTWQLWNDGHRAYFVAGSDAHDVWNEVSGAARTYVHVGGELTIDKFMDSLRRGRSYATQGPLIFPELIFGSEIEVLRNAAVHLKFDVYAINGLRTVQLVERGERIQQSDFADETTELSVEFEVESVSEDTWFSVVVVDSNDRRAYSNPIWVKISE